MIGQLDSRTLTVRVQGSGFRVVGEEAGGSKRPAEMCLYLLVFFKGHSDLNRNLNRNLDLQKNTKTFGGTLHESHVRRGRVSDKRTASMVGVLQK